jgi:hypothetical protein
MSDEVNKDINGQGKANREKPTGSEFGEKFGNDYGFGQEGERVEGPEGPSDEQAGYLDYYSPPTYTELDEVESPYGDQPPPDLSVPDEQIQREVLERLEQSRRVDTSGIEIAVNKGEVTLSGKVRSEDQYERAEDVAATVIGVRMVRNQLFIIEK